MLGLIAGLFIAAALALAPLAAVPTQLVGSVRGYADCPDPIELAVGRPNLTDSPPTGIPASVRSDAPRPCQQIHLESLCTRVYEFATGASTEGSTCRATR